MENSRKLSTSSQHQISTASSSASSLDATDYDIVENVNSGGGSEELNDDDNLAFESNETVSSSLLNDILTQTAVANLIMFSIALFVVPLMVMFVFKIVIFQGYFDMSSQDAILCAGISAIIIVYSIMALFVYVAWREETIPYNVQHPHID